MAPCYAPKFCPKYHSGPVREVPGRNGTSWTEEDWVDEEVTSERGLTIERSPKNSCHC